MPIPHLNQEDCELVIVDYLSANLTQAGGYGYDLYLSSLMRNWLTSRATDFGINRDQVGVHLPDVSPCFYSAAWDLCRRGILRPGVKRQGLQSTDDGSAGGGYSITPFGAQWLSEANRHIFVPTEPGRFSEMLSSFAALFGSGFQGRGNEAIRCYGSHAYLACCVMCGAGAESILLHLAIARTGDEADVLRRYRAANGRKAIENIIIGQQRNAIRQDFEICFSLLKYWRDEAAHGRGSNISENEAYASLALLLRCAQFARDNYQALTGQALPT